MKKIEIITDVKNGSLKRNRNLVKEAIKTFEGKTITLTMKVNRKQRTTPQNSYYWGVIVVIWQRLIQDEWGDFYSKEEVHEFLKYNCNFIERVNEQTGEVLRLSKSTMENTTTEQEEYHAKCRNLAFDMFNCQIPLPNEQINFEL